MKLKKLTIAFIAAISLIGTFSFNNEETQAASINTEAKKYKYSGVTYLYKMLKLEGIKYNKFPGVEYQNGKPEGIVVHETDDPGATAHDEAIYFNREWMNINAYVHAFVDSLRILPVILLSKVRFFHVHRHDPACPPKPFTSCRPACPLSTSGTFSDMQTLRRRKCMQNARHQRSEQPSKRAEASTLRSKSRSGSVKMVSCAGWSLCPNKQNAQLEDACVRRHLRVLPFTVHLSQLLIPLEMDSYPFGMIVAVGYLIYPRSVRLA